MKSHKDLDLWKKSIDLVTSIYRITKEYPKDETYGLINQIRRSAVSIPSNISEGAARKSTKEFVRFLYIALGSVAELETQLIISGRLAYISEDELNNQNTALIDIRNMNIGLIRHLEDKIAHET